MTFGSDNDKAWRFNGDASDVLSLDGGTFEKLDIERVAHLKMYCMNHFISRS